MRRTPLQRIVGYLGLAFLLVFAWNGIAGFVYQWDHATDLGRLIQTVCQLVYGCGALLLTLAALWAKRWEPIGRAVWTVGGTLAGGLAPAAWGGAPVWVSAVSLVASLGLTLGVAWMLRQGWPLASASV